LIVFFFLRKSKSTPEKNIENIEKRYDEKGLGVQAFKILQNYYVHLSPERFVCECRHFKRRGEICKHVYFIFGRVLKDVNLMCEVEFGLSSKDVFDSQRNFSLGMELHLLSSLVQKKERVMNKQKSFADNKKDDDCVICTETMKDMRVWVCAQCKNTLHPACIAKWAETKNENVCPYCRNTEEADQNNENDLEDPLSRFEAFYNRDGVFYA
jgi:DNA-directed RNA polymerase subunit RPC12/RpoP